MAHASESPVLADGDLTQGDLAPFCLSQVRNCLLKGACGRLALEDSKFRRLRSCDTRDDALCNPGAQSGCVSADAILTS